MKKGINILLTLLIAGSLFGQEEVEKVRIVVQDKTKDPLVFVYHNMGNVHVQGNDDEDIYVYARDLIPSLENMFNNMEMQMDSRTSERISTSNRKPKNDLFLISQRGNKVHIETNVFSFNKNVFVDMPSSSSVAVNIADMGGIEIKDITGDIEANTTSGSIHLINTEGVVVANTNFGNILGDFTRRGLTKPLLVSALVGNIEIILPHQAQHDLSLYSELGNVYSNFQNINQLSSDTRSEVANNRKISFALNGGGTDFVVKTFKGDIYLRH